MSTRLGNRLKYARLGLPSIYRVTGGSSNEPSFLTRLLFLRHINNQSLSIAVDAGERVELLDTSVVEHHSLKAGDVLLTAKFSAAENAWASLVGAKAIGTRIYCSNNIIVFHPDDGLLSEYLTLWLRSEPTQELLRLQSKQYQTLQCLNLKKLLELPIKFPSLDRQRELILFHEKTLVLKRRRDQQILVRDAYLDKEFRAIVG